MDPVVTDQDGRPVPFTVGPDGTVSLTVPEGVHAIRFRGGRAGQGGSEWSGSAGTGIWAGGNAPGGGAGSPGTAGASGATRASANCGAGGSDSATVHYGGNGRQDQ